MSIGKTVTAVGARNAKGEWQPPYPVSYAPIFVWPPRPLSGLKWLLGYPGFLWPWNSIYLGITVFCWCYLQPALARCAVLRSDWIALIFLRNLGLLWAVAGGWHLLLYTFRAQGAERKHDPRWPSVNDPKFLFHDQVWDNIFWSCLSGCTVWTAYEVFYFWACANRWVPSVDWREHPLYSALWLCAIPIWREFHF